LGNCRPCRCRFDRRKEREITSERGNFHPPLVQQYTARRHTQAGYGGGCLELNSSQRTPSLLSSLLLFCSSLATIRPACLRIAMAAVPRWSRSTPSLRLKPLVLAFLVLFTLWAWRSRSSDDRDVSAYQVKYPLTWKHVQMSRTRGGGTFTIKCHCLASASDPLDAYR
jgi:hypothetical protein